MNSDSFFHIPDLRPDLLATTIPVKTWGGGFIDDPTKTFLTFRTRALDRSLKGATLGFYVDDARFASVWKTPSSYAKFFRDCGFAGVVEPDFSVWLDATRDEQKAAIFKMRMCGRIFQGVGLRVVPNLAWSDKESFTFCFRGIPKGAPVCACEAVTAGQNDEDRCRFIAGLTEAVAQVEPKVILIYGGTSHEDWLRLALPKGPRFVMLDSFSKARKQFLRREANENQYELFGGKAWADEAQAAVA